MRKKRVTLALGVCLAFGAGVVGVGLAADPAPTGSIGGRVLSRADQSAVAGATCQTEASGEVTSDASGRFVIEGVPPGKVKVTCRKAGLREGSGRVTVRAGERSLLRVQIGEPAKDGGVAIGAKVRAFADKVKNNKKLNAAMSGMGDSLVVGHGTGGMGGGGVGYGRVHGMGKIDTGGARGSGVGYGTITLRGSGAGGGGQVGGRRTRGSFLRTSGRGAAIAQPAPAWAADAADREGYEKQAENAYREASQQPLSTLSIDVDTAAYSNTRRFIDQGRLPPADAPRIEDFVNYFTYDYPEPKGPHPFSITTEISVAPWNPGHRLVHLGLQARRIAREDLPPNNLVFLLDVSGSMNSYDKLPLLQSAFRLLVDNLAPDDRVAIVVYAGAAGLVLPSTEIKRSDLILSAIDSLRAGGSTAGGAGIELAYRIAQENFMKGGNNRVILATDGDFNVGVSSDGGLERLIEEKRKSGVFLTVLGFGQGNYQAAKMEKLANRGNGNFAYIDSILEAKKVLVSEMGGTLLTVAKDVKFQVEFNPAKVKAWRLLGYENRVLAARDFNDDKKDAGELGAGHTVTVLYELIPAGSDESVGGVDPLKYQRPAAVAVQSAGEGEDELMTVKLRYKRPTEDRSLLITHPLLDDEAALEDTSDDFRFSSAAAEFAMLLRGDEHRGDASYESALARAKGSLGEDAHGYRYEFTRLVEKARLLAAAQAAR